ncbi:hypothetical protein [Halodesulfovibrio marinisediminis]|uniref:Uncharacterized protein n=1 Tax=Halodesulfovibrio marinisediminis DSM 17456 TaxID=1121457 RepID=A0A1N6GPR0_9BACT|nr:hypothetical protein [Halodesulfovibrio marinisediminis]SIO09493.1 hypothetical protein SAMN02745161_1726 [Halodesulfovibrio marinisediminis DSM 17456]
MTGNTYFRIKNRRTDQITAQYASHVFKASGQKFIVPVGGGIGKVVKVWGVPINLQVQVFYNAIAPDEIGDYSARFQIQLLFPE